MYWTSRPPTPAVTLPKIADSLTRQVLSDSPTHSHLLSVGSSRVLALAADKDHIYAGCQGRDNEITVFCRRDFQPEYRLLGHEGSVLCLLVVPEKEWLVSGSSAGDVRVSPLLHA